MKSFFKNLFQPKVLVVSALVAAASVLAFAFNSNPVQASACPGFDDDNNAIVWCGFPDKSGFKSDYDVNKTGDIPAVYDYMGFKASDMDAIMGSRGVWGYTHKNGQVKLDDGRIVGTDAWSFGRQKFGNPNRILFHIPGSDKDYFKSPVSIGFSATTQKIRTLVLMDEENKYMVFAVMNACGNPVGFTAPKFQCKELKKEAVDDDTYKFWTEVELKNAVVKSLKYEVVDSDDKVIKTIDETDPSKKISIDFEPGKYTVRVTVKYEVNGDGIVRSETLQTKCKTEIEVEEEEKPNFECSILKANSLGELKYRFEGKATFENANVKSASFDYGDGTNEPALVIKDAGAGVVEIISKDHVYDVFTGKKTITLDVVFDIGEDTDNVKCKTEIAREVLEVCKPKPGEDENCQPVCTPKKGENEKCEIPQTGAGEIFAAAAGVSGLGAAGMYYRASRRNLSSLLDKFKR